MALTLHCRTAQKAATSGQTQATTHASTGEQ